MKDVFHTHVPVLREAIARGGLEGRVRLPGFVPDEELVHLYSRAYALVQPSLMEGFGLPAVEAMACGIPVVSSRAGVTPRGRRRGRSLLQPDRRRPRSPRPSPRSSPTALAVTAWHEPHSIARPASPGTVPRGPCSIASRSSRAIAVACGETPLSSRDEHGEKTPKPAMQIARRHHFQNRLTLTFYLCLSVFICG